MHLMLRDGTALVVVQDGGWRATETVRALVVPACRNRECRRSQVLHSEAFVSTALSRLQHQHNL